MIKSISLAHEESEWELRIALARERDAGRINAFTLDEKNLRIIPVACPDFIKLDHAFEGL